MLVQVKKIYLMTESLKKIVNQSMNQFPKNKLVQSISQLGTQVLNKSFQLNSESDDSVNNQELLKMEIKQLKRQNAFLKGKIQELKKGQLPNKPQLLKRQSLNCMNILKKRTDSKQFSHQNSVNFILKEIQSILKSLASIHKIQTDDKGWAVEDFSQINDELEEKESIRLDKEYRQKMNKKLQMIPLSKQQTRYGSLLEIFSEFYQLKIEEERKMKQKIQKYIEKTIEISKKLIQNANTKAYEKSMKSSCIYSTTNAINSDTSITYNNNMAANGLTFLYQKSRFGHNPQKHELSYSTIDAQYVQRDTID